MNPEPGCLQPTTLAVSATGWPSTLMEIDNLASVTVGICKQTITSKTRQDKLVTKTLNVPYFKILKKKLLCNFGNYRFNDLANFYQQHGTL